MLELQQRLAVATATGVNRVTTGLSRRTDASVGAMRWVWVVLLGILVIAAAAAFVWCKRLGHNGFTGNIEAVRGPFGVKIGIKIGCY